ncbi:DNA helicase-2/ATP-dependent DNA helicase PcrA [Neorhizobium galegae]|uniref:UvrD-helicase domain-containing protein n=1 Tax=Neorhizobium galegae TaxID=399 RepID=UPI001AE54C46|nr:UvrD-helicase domain-containing protein [Neorhizobium galegae]MBP2558736.1 DNA helicase-2/ATP-dependent DNA helicase PcrA [Neorhizobium galegae]MDQ0135756.1 DNA helicase-2/ATP-dependent DNA helicase PcrA [Neorhizobium galegae]
MPLDNKIILASAGSGKTYGLVQEASAEDACRNALVTYTIRGKDELAGKAYELFGAIPPHLTVGTWYSFVLKHFVRPYQNHLFDPWVSHIRFERIPLALRKIPKSKTGPFYFGKGTGIWQDRVTDFACRIIEKTNGLPIKRLEAIFQRIYFDEAQDLSGWDLELIEHLLRSKIKITLVGDHRQATFKTNDNPKNKKFAGKDIIGMFEQWDRKRLASIEHQTHSRRCNQAICDFADTIFPDCRKTRSLQEVQTPHDGLFLVRLSDLQNYVDTFGPQPLRYDRRRIVEFGNPINFGESKGMTFDRTLVFPHGPYLKFLGSGNLADAGKELARIYVSLTRARYSVGFVVPDNFRSSLLPFFEPIIVKEAV